MSEDKKNAKVKVASLWWNKMQDGNKYLAGNWGSTRVLIFPNGYKDGEKDPDFRMFLAQRIQQANPPAGNDVPGANEAEDTAF